MNQLGSESKNNQNIVRAAMLLAVIIVIQALGRFVPQINQFFVGPGVNAILILIVLYCGSKWGVISGMLTPVLAYMVGQLAAPMAPFIPFIMAGNIAYVLLFGLLKKYKYGTYIGVILASVVKYLVLSVSAVKLIYWFNIGIPEKVAKKLAVMMGIPQLITGLVGGAIALVLIWMLTKRKVLKA